MLKEYLKKYTGKGIQIDIEPGETVQSKDLGLVLSGLLGIYSGDALLNLLKEEDIFGVAQVFQPDIRTEIRAKKNTKLVLFPQDILLTLLGEDQDFMKEYIQLMADKIRFLNMKIKTLTSKSCEERLYAYLLDQAEEKGTFLIPVKGQELSGALNMSRASLYRALEILEEEKKIEKNGKTIRLL